ncbi:hypothetical protein [Nocardioides sp.]|uniref:Uncharacterized protein n=1 Tax=metagenome TaxID=256318 RepID=A0A2P2BX89_9ZZZZ
MSDWVGVVIGGLALGLSGYTWIVQHRRQVLADRAADVTVAFHWLRVRAHVTIPGRGEFQAGYHLVLTNRGPAAARNVDVRLSDSDGHPLTLLDLVPGELPLAVLDADGRYPIPWIYEPFSRHARRFEAIVSWTDDAGPHQRRVPLRRGQLPD